jgi:carbamoyl-phosphate synthase large subunit
LLTCSALASKATGYPLAYTAAKIALGHTLPELPNAVTKSTTACFEPSLDYIVTKIPKWDLAKFQHVERNVGSAMKSVGEVMAIGRTFEESLQKAIRQVDPNFSGFDAYWKPEDMHTALTENNDRRLFAIAHAMLNLGYDVEKLHDLTKIDRWFLYKLENIVEVYKQIQTTPFEQWDEALLRTAKRTGFSDLHIAQLSGRKEDEVGLDVVVGRNNLTPGPGGSKVLRCHPLRQANRHPRRRVPCLHQLPLHHIQRLDSRHRLRRERHHGPWFGRVPNRFFG